jgi:signal peptidase II
MERSTAKRTGGVQAQLRLFATALIIILADQVVKRVVVHVLAMGGSRAVLGNFFRLTRTENTGAAFGIFRGQSTWFIVISALAAVAIVFFRREIAKMRGLHQLAFGLILGGALGNLIDRIRMGAVVDYLDIGFGSTRWPAFNIADSAITIGVVLLAVHLVFFADRGGAGESGNTLPTNAGEDGEARDDGAGDVS